jgi:hypothetical protein
MIFQESSFFFGIFQVFFSGNKNVHTISSFKNNIYIRIIWTVLEGAKGLKSRNT